MASGSAHPSYSIGQASAATGVSADTLRFYERAGIVPAIGRDGSGNRRYQADDLGWIAFVRRLRSTGMPIEQIGRYATMVHDDLGTVAERRQLVQQHRERVAAAITELTDALDVLDRKLQHYNAAERGVDVGCDDQPLQHVTFRP